jgi:hypothetical protein
MPVLVTVAAPKIIATLNLLFLLVSCTALSMQVSLTTGGLIRTPLQEHSPLVGSVTQTTNF